MPKFEIENVPSMMHSWLSGCGISNCLGKLTKSNVNSDKYTKMANYSFNLWDANFSFGMGDDRIKIYFGLQSRELQDITYVRLESVLGFGKDTMADLAINTTKLEPHLKYISKGRIKGYSGSPESERARLSGNGLGELVEIYHPILNMGRQKEMFEASRLIGMKPLMLLAHPRK